MAAMHWRFKILNIPFGETDVCLGYGATEAEARAELETSFPGEVGEMVEGPIELYPNLKTDFGPNGPQPGTYAYTAAVMAQMCPGGDEDDPDFWDRWKDEMKDQMID